MPTPRQAADALVALTTTADPYITALRPLLVQIATAEADLRRALVEAGKPLNDHVDGRARVPQTVHDLIDRNPGKTLTQIVQSAFAVELAS